MDHILEEMRRLPIAWKVPERSPDADDAAVAALGRLEPTLCDEAPAPQRFGSADAWLIRHRDTTIVLKRGRIEQTEDDVEWEHQLLHDLSGDGFPVSRPVPAFGDRCWASVNGRIWSTYGYIPGQPLASEQDPDMHAAGAFLARYHRSARLLRARPQRPTTGSTGALRAVTPLDAVQHALGTTPAMHLFLRLLSDLEHHLPTTGHESSERVAVHGDATNHNLIVSGDQPGIVGLIDFGAAHIAPWPTDIGNALWRSGRAHDTDVALSATRVAQFVAGYTSEAQSNVDLAHIVPIILQARGLQLISRRVRRLLQSAHGYAVPDVSLALHRAAWMHDHRSELAAVIGKASGRPSAEALDRCSRG